MMGQIEVLYDLGEPYVRLENYRAVQAHAADLAAEVERLKADNATLRARVAELEAALDDAQLLAEERGDMLEALEANGWLSLLSAPVEVEVQSTVSYEEGLLSPRVTYRVRPTAAAE